MNIELHIENEFKKVSDEIRELTLKVDKYPFFLIFSKKYREMNEELNNLHVRWHLLFDLMNYNPNIPKNHLPTIKDLQ